MGASGLSLTVSGDGDRAALHEAIWEHLREVIDMYASGDSYRAIIAYLMDAIPTAEDRGHWGPVEDRLAFLFPDFAGCCSRSAGAWTHLLGVAVAIEWDRLCMLAEERDLAITSERRSFADEAKTEHYVVLRDELWMVGEDRIHGDDSDVVIESLDAAERDQVTVARERCICGMCVLVRPDDKPARSLLGALDDAPTVSSAGWYLSRIDAKRPDVLIAMIRAGVHDAPGMGTPVERYAQHLGAQVVWELVPPLLVELHHGAKALALRALDITMTPGGNRDVLVREVLAGLAGNDELAVVAAEIAGHLGRAGDGVDVELADAVATILDRGDASDPLRHSAVLGLVNLHLPRKPISPAIKARLERESTLDTEAGKLATWMLSW